MYLEYHVKNTNKTPLSVSTTRATQGPDSTQMGVCLSTPLAAGMNWYIDAGKSGGPLENMPTL